MRRKLLEFLDKSKFYHPERMLSRFPSDGIILTFLFTGGSLESNKTTTTTQL